MGLLNEKYPSSPVWVLEHLVPHLVLSGEVEPPGGSNSLGLCRFITFYSYLLNMQSLSFLVWSPVLMPPSPLQTLPLKPEALMKSFSYKLLLVMVFYPSNKE